MPTAPRIDALNSSTKPGPELPVLTGLRFLAAFSVLIAHGLAHTLRINEGMGASLIYWTSQFAGFGMTLFFVLSGFVIHYNYNALVTKGGIYGCGFFMWARFARLYPLFFFILLIDVILGKPFTSFLAGDTTSFEDVLRALPYFLLLLQSWFYVPIGNNSIIYSAGTNVSLTWSISTEWFFYLTYPLLALALAGLRRPLATLSTAFIWGLTWTVIATSLFRQAPGLDAWAATNPDDRD
jgi:peptidoglycan/LPS O-acetylase OafA/YrhL